MASPDSTDNLTQASSKTGGAGQSGQASSPVGIEDRQLQGRLGGLTLPRQVLVLAIWPLMEQLLAYLVGTVDLSLAGHLAPDSLQVAATDALGVTSYVSWLMMMIHSAAGVGATALIARAVGRQHRSLANAVLGQSVVLGAISGVIAGAGVFALAPAVGQLAGLNGQSLELCILYLRIVSLATPLYAILLVGSACLRGAGDTKMPFVVMVVVNAVNITTSVAFVYGPAPLGGHGVGGIAAGTVIAWAVGCVLILTALIRQWGPIKLHLHRLRPHAHTLRRIIRIATPNLFESVAGMWVANFLVLMIVGRLGRQGYIGAHMIAIRIESLSFLSGYALGIAAGTLSGQYLGLGDPKRARQAATLCWAAGAVIMGVLGLVFIFIPEYLAMLITDSPVMLELTVTPIRICGPIQIFFATQVVLGGALRGAGDTRATMWITTTSTFLVRLPLVYLMGVVLDLGLNGIWVALCGELVFRGTIFGCRFFLGRWEQVKV